MFVVIRRIVMNPASHSRSTEPPVPKETTMRLPIALAALAVAAFLTLPPSSAQAGGLHAVGDAVHRIGSDFFAFITYPFHRDAAPAKPVKAKAKAKAAPKKM
jgi:hypothetical protein